MHATPLRHRTGGVIVSHVDITERKLAEEALRRSERMQAEAEKLAATGRMAARVAHEINNPLAGIKNAYRLVRDAVPADHPDRDMVERIDREIARISGIVRQMYTLYSPQAGRLTEVVVSDVIQDVLAMLEPLCREAGVQFAAHGVLPGLKVRMPEGGLNQVVFNLLTNAIEASPPGGVVTVAAGLDGSCPGLVKIRIHDQGQGISPDIRPRVFEPFFTSKTGDRAKGGVGLGLVGGQERRRSGRRTDRVRRRAWPGNHVPGVPPPADAGVGELTWTIKDRSCWWTTRKPSGRRPAGCCYAKALNAAAPATPTKPWRDSGNAGST
jgi:signal transduction histidine kinase